jgi:hypothetical protein
MTDPTTDDYGEWLRLAQEAFGVTPSGHSTGSDSHGLSGFTANWMTRYGA